MDSHLPVFLPEIGMSPRMPPRIPHGAYRHAAPPGPWPWQDLVEEVPFNPEATRREISIDMNATDVWKGYPSFLFPNWTISRLERSGIAKIIFRKPSDDDADCVIYHTDVGHDGHFSSPGERVAQKDDLRSLWISFKDDQNFDRRVRVLSLENLSGDVLQMLGTIYKIEPFFFSSSLNWIPSRYQEDVNPGQGDHITVTLTFPRTMPNPMTAANTPLDREQFMAQMVSRVGTATIDTQAPLILRSKDRILILDMLSIHMIRRPSGSTIMTYHPSPEWKSTSARYLQSRVRYAGESVYWQSLFRRSSDPTLVLLCMIWYALYAWDESLENLYSHICHLESRVLVANDIHLTRELHIIRASLLHYTSLLENFRRTVQFVRNTPNPAVEARPDFDESAKLLNRECDTLVSEIDRLEMFRKIQEMRLENIMNLAFSTINFDDSRDMRRLTEAALRDSAVMKQLSYLTMIFLPGTFVATVFGMNITGLSDGAKGQLSHYLAITFPLTALTIWLVIALRGNFEGGDFVDRLKWPIQTVKQALRRKRKGLRVGVV